MNPSEGRVGSGSTTVAEHTEMTLRDKKGGEKRHPQKKEKKEEEGFAYLF